MPLWSLTSLLSLEFFFGYHREVGSICFAITDDSWIEHNITLQEVLGLVIARDSIVFNLLSWL